MTATRNIPNWNNSDHVTIPPPPFYMNGGKKKWITPEKSGEPPAGVLVAPLTA